MKGCCIDGPCKGEWIDLDSFLVQSRTVQVPAKIAPMIEPGSNPVSDLCSESIRYYLLNETDPYALSITPKAERPLKERAIEALEILCWMYDSSQPKNWK